MSTNALTVEKRTDAELTSFDDRPDDCQCWDPDATLPCWPCYRDGFESQNPNADTEDTA